MTAAAEEGVAAATREEEGGGGVEELSGGGRWTTARNRSSCIPHPMCEPQLSAPSTSSHTACLSVSPSSTQTPQQQRAALVVAVLAVTPDPSRSLRRAALFTMQSTSSLYALSQRLLRPCVTSSLLPHPSSTALSRAPACASAAWLPQPIRLRHVIVQNRAKRGLFAGKHVQHGNSVSHSHRKSPRTHTQPGIPSPHAPLLSPTRSSPLCSCAGRVARGVRTCR